jgi:hypothetical protein
VEGRGVSRLVGLGVAGLKFSKVLRLRLSIVRRRESRLHSDFGPQGPELPRCKRPAGGPVPACRGRWRSGGTRSLTRRAHWHLRVPTRRATSAPSEPVRVIAIWDFTGERSRVGINANRRLNSRRACPFAPGCPFTKLRFPARGHGAAAATPSVPAPVTVAARSALSPLCAGTGRGRPSGDSRRWPGDGGKQGRPGVGCDSELHYAATSGTWRLLAAPGAGRLRLGLGGRRMGAKGRTRREGPR